MTPSLAVAGWVWTTTTALGAIVAVALLGLLGADVLATAVSLPDERRPRGDPARRRRLGRIAVVVAALFVAVVLVRFALIIVDYPGPKR
jgi:hypothetical protein